MGRPICSVTSALIIGTTLPLRDDEILYSWIGCMSRRNSFAPAMIAVNMLLGGRCRTLSVDLPTGLENLQATLGDFSPLPDSHSWIDRATLYPYHRPFLTRERDHVISESMLRATREGGAQKALMGRLANRFGAATSLRYCPLCVCADTAGHFEPYWRRSWLLPGVELCPTHGVRLVEFAPATRPSNPFESRPPPTSTQTINCVPCTEGSLPWAFSKLSSELLHSNLAALSGEKVVATYKNRALELGYAYPTGRVSVSKVVQAVREHYKDFEGFPHRDRLLQTHAMPLAWLRTIFTRPDRAVHPMCHLMLIGHLFGSIATWRDALESDASFVPIAASPLRTPQKRRSKLDGPELLDSSMSCRAAAAALGVDTATVVAYRRNCGMKVTTRSHKTTRMSERKIVDELVAGTPLATVARNNGVSMATVCRILRFNAAANASRQANIHQANSHKAKKEWLAAVCSVDSITEARRIAPAAYAWLYRNDRTFIVTHRKSEVVTERKARFTNRVDWHLRDQNLSAQVHKLKSAEVERGATERCSPHRILRILGVQTMMIRNRHRLPFTYDALIDCIETESMWRDRRLTAAKARITALGLPLTTARLLKAANINWTYRHWVGAWLDARRVTVDQEPRAGSIV